MGKHRRTLEMEHLDTCRKYNELGPYRVFENYGTNENVLTTKQRSNLRLLFPDPGDLSFTVERYLKSRLGNTLHTVRCKPILCLNGISCHYSIFYLEHIFLYFITYVIQYHKKNDD